MLWFKEEDILLAWGPPGPSLLPFRKRGGCPHTIMVAPPPCTRLELSPVPDMTCHVTSSALSLVTEQEASASEIVRADRWYRAEYELFNYFYRN